MVVHLSSFEWFKVQLLSDIDKASQFGKPVAFHSVISPDRRNYPLGDRPNSPEEALARIERVLPALEGRCQSAILFHEIFRTDGSLRWPWAWDFWPAAVARSRALAPSVKLLIGDYRLLARDGAKWRALISFCAALRDAGAPLDGADIQVHRYIQRPFPTFRLGRLVARLRAEGLEPVLGECNVFSYQGEAKTWDAERRWRRQAEVWGQILGLAARLDLDCLVWQPFERYPAKLPGLCQGPTFMDLP